MKLKLAMATAYPVCDGVITGGVEGVAHCLTQEFKKNLDIDIHILAPAFGRKPGLESRNGVTIHWLKVSALPAVVGNWSFFRRTIHNCLVSINPDITHFQDVASWSLHYRKPYVLTIHGINEKDMLYKEGPFLAVRRMLVAISERLGRQQAPHTILISPYVVDEIGKQIRGQKWHIENPVTQDFFEVVRRDFGPRVLYVGRISPRKNVDGLLRAFAIVKHQMPTATLHIAGTMESQDYEHMCRAIIEEKKIGDAVEFLGNIDKQRLLQELSYAKCLTLLSHQETAPMTVEESMAAGVPVVASRICGLPHMIDESITGFLVESERDEEIASRIVHLLTNDEDNRRMGENCRKVACDRFHAERVAEKTLEVYCRVLSLK